MRLPAPVILLALLWVPTQRLVASPIVNGDFEALPNFFANPGSPQTQGGWTFNNFAGVEGTGGNPGKKVRLESNGLPTSDPTISQVVTGLTVGASYTLEWDWARRVTLQGGTGRSFGVFLDSQSFANALFLGEYLSTAYSQQSVAFVATSASHTIIFAGELDARSNGLAGSDTDVSYNLDNVALSSLDVAQVPEPSTLALFSATLSVLAVARRLSRTKTRI